MYCYARGDSTWLSLESNHAILYYKCEESLRRFNKKIEVPEIGPFCAQGSVKSRECLELSVLNKIDAIFEKVQHILEMKRKMAKVRIYLYPNKRDLHDAYYTIYHTRKKYRAWYIFEYNSIYMNARDLHEGMLAHELAHAVIDNHFSGPPPRAAAEILARYVDAHLFKEVKTYK